MSLFAELRRRSVFRVGTAYVFAAWLILQVVDVVVPILELPNSVPRFVLFALLVGFFLALILAWAYELTPQGIKRDEDVDPEEPENSRVAMKFNVAIFILMAAAISFLIVDNYLLDSEGASTPSLGRSIAVLPFRNLSVQEGDSFFADGIQDDLLTQLSRVPTFDKVISRTSTERFRNSVLSMDEIGRALGVANIVEGGIQRAGSRVRVNVQLIDAATDRHLWAKTYDRELSAEQLFEIQTEITREIVAALHGVLSGNEVDSIKARATDSLAAYEQYTLGRLQLSKRTAGAIRAAGAFFERAVELDPDYALAWVALAESKLLTVQYLGQDVGELVAPVTDAVDRALELDPLLGEAYASLGLLYALLFDPEKSEKNYLKAIELSPNYATSFFWYAQQLQGVARHEEALLRFRKAIELDPLAPVFVQGLARVLRSLGRPEEARTTLLEGLEDNPKFPGFYAVLSEIALFEGKVAEALRWMEESNRLSESGAGNLSMVCYLQIVLDREEDARDCVERFDAAYPDYPFSPRIALYFATDDSERAVKDIEDVVARAPYLAELLAAVYVSVERWDDAYDVIAEASPEMLGESTIEIGNQNLDLAINAAIVLYQQGNKDRANYLFDLCLELLSSMHRTRGLASGILDVRIHAVRDEQDKAVAALRDAYNNGFRMEAMLLREPVFRTMEANTEWLEVVRMFEDDIARQRAWYEENKDKPLF